MTKFELARTAGRWRPRLRTYVALAILFVTAWATNADVFHDAFAWRPSIDAKGEVSSRRGHLRPLLLHSSWGGRYVGQALAESNIKLFDFVSTPAASLARIAVTRSRWPSICVSTPRREKQEP